MGVLIRPHYVRFLIIGRRATPHPAWSSSLSCGEAFSGCRTSTQIHTTDLRRNFSAAYQLSRRRHIYGSVEAPSVLPLPAGSESREQRVEGLGEGFWVELPQSHVVKAFLL